MIHPSGGKIWLAWGGARRLGSTCPQQRLSYNLPRAQTADVFLLDAIESQQRTTKPSAISRSAGRGPFPYMRYCITARPGAFLAMCEKSNVENNDGRVRGFVGSLRRPHKARMSSHQRPRVHSHETRLTCHYDLLQKPLRERACLELDRPQDRMIRKDKASPKSGTPQCLGV